MSDNDAGPPPKRDATLSDVIAAINALQPEPRRRNAVWRATAWVLAIGLTAVIANVAVPGAHRTFTTVGCYGKYLRPGRTTYPATTAWQKFGVTSVQAVSSTAVTVHPLVAGYQWFGATLPFGRYCDYRLSFSAVLSRPIISGKGIGYGYAVGVKGTTINGVPNAVTTQYDPPFAGLRIVPIPCCADQPGYNAVSFPKVVSGVSHPWLLTVIGSTAYVSFDGKGFGTMMSLGSGNEILIRVWNASVTISDVKISAIRPAL